MAFRPAWLAAAASLTLSSLALAQDVGKPAGPAAAASASAGTAPTTSASAAPGAAGAAGSDATNGAVPTAPAGPAAPMGYAYGSGSHHGDAAAPRASGHARAHHASGPIATLPGFELLPEGGSRLFVQLTANVQVAEKPVAGGITYVLKGTHVAKRNNENALITVHFNTPVTRARLLPAGGDLHFVVDLRQNVKATWKLVPAKDGATVLEIDFPAGDYLHDGSTDASDDAASAAKAPAATAKPPAK